MPVQTFIVNGAPITVDVHPDVRVLWVLRDLLGVTGPKYGCGINVCKACTSHVNERAFNPCSVKVGDLTSTDRIDTIEGLGAQAGLEEGALHPMQQAWIDRDVAQCGFCQPGQIMAAVALVKKVRREGREIDDTDLDNIRNICRCGAYARIREAILQGARGMATLT